MISFIILRTIFIVIEQLRYRRCFFLGFPSNKDIETEYDSNPLTFDELIQYEDNVLANTKTRTRRHSSGEKKKSSKMRYFMKF